VTGGDQIEGGRMICFERIAGAGLRVVLLAIGGAAFLGLGTGSASAAPYCSGSSITGLGAALQWNLQTNVWSLDFEKNICPSSGIKIHYNYSPEDNSSDGLREWNAYGDKGSISTVVQFVGTTEAPTAAQIGSITSVAGGASLLTIPVAQNAISIVANPPEGCTVEEITTQDVGQVFRGNINNWSGLGTTEGKCESPIKRVVRKDASGVTYQFKNYLYAVSPNPVVCSPGNATWQELAAAGKSGSPNTTWPEACPEAPSLSEVLRPASGPGVRVVETVNANDGSIGYAAITDVKTKEVPGTTVALRVQNNGWKKLSEATFASPIAGSKEANCGEATYVVPPNGQRVPEATALNVDWSQVFGFNPGIGGSNYPICTLTYALAFHGYSAAGFTFKNYKTVYDYLHEYIPFSGQGAIAEAGWYYAPLPSSGTAKKDVLGAAQYASGKINY
jgi:ABC-type phosphate transport system substrate-binding protein